MFRSILLFLLFICLSGRLFAQLAPIVIETAKTSIVYKIKKNGRMYQAYLGEKLNDTSDYAALPDTKNEAYIGGGMEDLFTPAIQVEHADKNPSLELHFQSMEVKQQDKNTTVTSILLKDPKYSFEVTLNFAAYY